MMAEDTSSSAVALTAALSRAARSAARREALLRRETLTARLSRKALTLLLAIFNPLGFAVHFHSHGTVRIKKQQKLRFQFIDAIDNCPRRGRQGVGRSLECRRVDLNDIADFIHQ